MLAVFIELILGLVGEVAIEVITEVVFEVVLYGFADHINFRSKSFAAGLEATGYGLVGVMLGVITIFALPWSFIENPELRVANLILSPLAAGAVMAGIGALRRKRGQNPISLDRFLNGASFGLGLTIVRFFFT